MKCLLLFITMSAAISSLAVQDDRVERDLSVRVVSKEGELKLMVMNHTLAPLDFYVKESESKTVVKECLVAPMDSLICMDIEGEKDSTAVKSFNEQFDLGYYLGDPKVVHDSTYLYRFPFKKGKKYEVSQTFNGKFSHNHIASKYAIDFQLEVGEPVHAAREGVVIKVEKHFKDHGGEEYKYKANRIILLHEDGTTASYVHLDYNGVLVEEGEYVEKGQHIGYSGLTGFTRGPHLHFVVRRGKDIAVPVYFEGYEGKVLKRRKRYKRVR